MIKRRVLQTSISLCLILSFVALCTVVQAQNETKVDSLFAKWDKPDTPGAAVAIIKDGEFVLQKGYGMANLDYNIPITDQSVFRIASVSKQFTAACIILLKEKGKLNLDDSLNSFFPDFPDYAKKITVRHLLHHTSGIRDYLTLASLSGYTASDYYTNNEVMRWLKNQKEPNFKPGSEHLYSNTGYWLLGQIVKEVSSQPMADFAKSELFKPLGMNNTHFHDNHKRVVKNRATGYQPKNDSTFLINTTTLDMIGDGGIFTTINDMKKWSDSFHDSDYLQQSFWDAMTEKGKLNNGESINYAAGLSIRSYKGVETISHGGAFVGYRAYYIRFPEQHFSIVFFVKSK
ncbi:serine hydrolase domain-containing protein [Fodinibius sp. AD559]|uniref:serine hydrolase domain-containing protein n=1 Tax=Fodinibius sp. AD559 TaxID=3424179 RepID=UPI004046B4DB